MISFKDIQKLIALAKKENLSELQIDGLRIVITPPVKEIAVAIGFVATEEEEQEPEA